MNKIKVFIVDDSSVIRRLLTTALAQDPEIELVGQAVNGAEALIKIPLAQPDLVTLDVEMPELSGLQALPYIHAACPKIPVIMFSTLTEKGAAMSLDALAKGAADCVAKPSTGSAGESLEVMKEDLLPKIKALCRKMRPPEAPMPPPPRRDTTLEKAQAVVIGVSTGGPNALAALLPTLTKPFPVPVLIVQHMPPVFTKILAERLKKESGQEVREGVDGEAVRPGDMIVAPGGYHMTVQREGTSVRLRMNTEPPENSCRPAADVLFRSAAKTYGTRLLAVVLTGMGKDALIGCEAIRKSGGHILAQDEASSVVWGMPGYVSQAGLADRVLPLTHLGAEISRRVTS